MSGDLLIRDAVISDAESLCDAEREVVTQHVGLLVSLPQELQPSAFRDRIANANIGCGKYVVVESNGQIVGHASLWPMGLQQIAHVFRLDMCVHVGHWRQGYGRAMLRHLTEWAGANQAVHKIELLVRSTNTPAIQLYRSFGFFDEGRHLDRVKLQDGRFLDDIAMALSVLHEDA